jgi:hypothetical protein
MLPVLAASSSCAASGIIDPVCQGVSSLGSSIVGSGASAVFDAMSTWVGTGSAWLLGQIGAALNSSTAINLSAPWFLVRYRAAEGILGIVALPLLLATAIQALIQQRPSLLLRAALVQLPLAMVFAGAAVELASMALSITDQLSGALSSTSPGAVQNLMESIASVIVHADSSSGSAAPAFIGLLGALVVALAALVLWVELVIRTSAIYVAVAFLPLVLVSMVWPALASWSRRLAETIMALILSKLVVVAVLEMAVGALGAQSQEGFAAVVTGIGLLSLAAFAPFSLFRLLPMFESSAALALEGLRSRASHSVLHGASRQAGSLALGLAKWTPPLVSTASAVTSGSADGTRAVGVESAEDPMASSAIRGTSDPGPPPTVPASRQAPKTEREGRAEAVRWPGADPVPTPQPAMRRLPSLVIDRDELGPIIRRREGAPEDRQGG